MAKMDLLSNLFQLFVTKLQKKERHLLETTLFIRLYQELINYHKQKNTKMENAMVSSPIIGEIVNELLIDDEYTLQGLANYTGYPEDVIYDLAAGLNNNPTLNLSAKIIELHAIARRDFYSELIKKIINKVIIDL